VKDKVVLVSGGARGIGLLISKAFVKNGAKVYICSRSKKICEEVAQQLTSSGPGCCFAIDADLSKANECERVAKWLAEREKKLHVLVNNSGNNWGAPLESYPDSAWDRVLSLNVKAVFHLTRALVPLLSSAASPSDPARVINIGSIDGIRIPSLETYAYSASKAAVHQLTKALANKLGTNHITVNAIACGPFESKMMAETLKNFGDVMIAGIPLARIGNAEDIEGIMIYLSSRASSWVTGTVIPLEGGILVKAHL